MDSSDVGPDAAAVVRRYALGLGILVATVFLSNVFGFLQHPERVFDVYGNTPLETRLHLVGFVGQLTTGVWLGCALVFGAQRGVRLATTLWLLSLTLFFAPMPSAREELWLAPTLLVVVGAVAWVSHQLRTTLEQHAV